jgi:hypothetical protein
MDEPRAFVLDATTVLKKASSMDASRASSRAFW